MLNHTKKVKEIYEDIQKKLFYIIPEKWDKLYLYSSVIDLPEGEQTGELYFYYIPKGILKKKPVNVYEIPNKFNLDENEYVLLVGILYEKIKQLRKEFAKSETTGKLWTNLTMSIENLKFKVQYNYDDLVNSQFDSYERHIIWRYQYLGIGAEQLGKKEKEILNRYFLGAKTVAKQEVYETGIYIKDIENIIGYDTDEYNDHNNNNENYEEVKQDKQPQKPEKKRKNQLLFSEEEIRKMQKEQKNNK